MSLPQDDTPVSISFYSVLDRLKFRPNLHWEKEDGKFASGLIHKLVDENGKVVGSGLLRQDAVKKATRHYLAQLPEHKRTQSEYVQHALLVPAGLTVASLEAGGNTRFLEAVQELRQELAMFYDRQIQVNPNLKGQTKEQSIAHSVDMLLAQPMESRSRPLTIPGGRQIVFVKEAHFDQAVEARRAMHAGIVEQALSSGQYIPDQVLADYPQMAAKAKPYQLTRAQFLRYQANSRQGEMEEVESSESVALPGPGMEMGAGIMGLGAMTAGPAKRVRVKSVPGVALRRPLSKRGSKAMMHGHAAGEFDEHRESVLEALAEGIEIAMEILEDYEDLQAQEAEMLAENEEENAAMRHAPTPHPEMDIAPPY